MMSNTGAGLRARNGLACFLIALGLASCDDPQEPAPAQTPGIQARYDATSKSFTFGIETTPGEFSALRLVGSDVRFEAETQSVYVRVSVRNDGNTALAGPDRLVVSNFTPVEVQPLNAEACTEGATSSVNGASCTYVHAGTYGDDAMLGPGEASTPIEWVLNDPSGESFAFRVRLQAQNGSTIAGIVFEDLNGNGVRDPEDPVRAETEVLLQGEAGYRSTRTDANGLYGFPVEAPGLYRVDMAPERGWRVTTPHPYEVLIVRKPDGTLSGFGRAHFGCQRQVPTDGIVVAGIVFNDLNRDGIFDPTEPGIPGIEVYGGARNCPTFAPIGTITGRDGRYELRLPLCRPPYEVGRLAPRGFVGTTPEVVVFNDPPVSGVALRADFGLAATDATCIESPAMLIDALARAYGERDLEAFRALLANVPDANAQFVFFLPEPKNGETVWGYTEEVRIHQRMFHPESLPPGEPPVPAELWLQSVAVTIVPEQAFSERPDLYASNGGPLDPTRWRAMGALYRTAGFWELAGDIDYRVDGAANFVVIEDLTKQGCETGKFLLFAWEDLGMASDPATAVAPATWADVKSLYR